VEVASGDITAEGCRGEFEFSTASGDVDIRNCTGEFELQTASGDIEVDDCEGEFNLGVASGDIDAVGVTLNNPSSFETASGDVDIALDASAEHDLVISTTDEVEHFLLPKLIGRLATDSPQSRIIFKVLERDYAAKQLELGNVDLVITPNWHIPEHLKQKLVYADDFVVLFRKGHPLEMQKLGIENYLSARHLMVRTPLYETMYSW